MKFYSNSFFHDMSICLYVHEFINALHGDAVKTTFESSIVYTSYYNVFGNISLFPYFSSSAKSYLCLTHCILQIFTSNMGSSHTTRKGTLKFIFNDPEIKEQWYFVKNNALFHGLSHDLEGVWAQNITGQGVIVGLIGGGLQESHRDLALNYDKYLSYNYVRDTPYIIESKAGHATEIAGLVAAVSNNRQCGVGAAPSSKIANIQIKDDETRDWDDLRTSRALGHKNNSIHIYLLAFSIDFRTEISGIPGQASIDRLVLGSEYGRNMLGSIYIIGSGSNRLQGSNCAFRGYQQRHEIFVIGSVTGEGKSAVYSEACTAVIASALSAKTFTFRDSLYSTTSCNHCRKSVRSVGASSDIAAGLISLLISHQPNLTTRHIMHLLILTSTQYDPSHITNAAGFNYSYTMGFGLINIIKLINYYDYSSFIIFPPLHICTTYIFHGSEKILKNSYKLFYIYTTGCCESVFCVSSIEEVYFIFSLTTQRRNSVKIHLTSPSGTKLLIIDPRPMDVSTEGFNNWVVKIMGYFGENPMGFWVLEITCEDFSSKLKNFWLKFYGTCNHDKPQTVFNNIISKNLCINYPGNINYYRKIKNISKSVDSGLGNDLFSFTCGIVDRYSKLY